MKLKFHFRKVSLLKRFLTKELNKVQFPRFLVRTSGEKSTNISVRISYHFE